MGSSGSRTSDLFTAIPGLILTGLLAAWWFGAFDDPPPTPPKIPQGGVRYEGRVYSAWSDRPLSQLLRTFESRGIYCSDYKYRKEISSEEYIIYCRAEHEGRDLFTTAHVVFPNAGEIVGPVSTDDRLK